MSDQFESLSLKDLLDAREAYHWHLLSKQNVIATAVGRYLIRDSEDWPTNERPEETVTTGGARRPRKGKRTLQNSGVRPYSWPCVLVFVKSWVDQEEFGGRNGRYDPTQMVPATLYLSDGRMVPVCVVEATAAEGPLVQTRAWEWPDSLIGGGFPIELEVQGQNRVASVGCLVTDGHLTYALTSRHVAGEPGTVIYSRLRGRRLRVGLASAKQVTRAPLTSLYEGFSGAYTSVNLDVGLVAVDNINDWTSQVYGIGMMGPLMDLSTRTLSLKLIDEQVVASGAASGMMAGKIKAFFYRYQSVAGMDHVSDFLIEPLDERAVSSRPGDSGTVWLLKSKNDKDAPPRPIAIQWGGHTFSGGQGSFAYGLATGLSNICSRLEVDLVTGHNTGIAPFWGKVGHYSIAAFAIGLVSDGRLRDLMTANADRISFDTGSLDKKTINDALDDADFIPLADVPDLVWKARSRLSRGPSENPTHYADVDEPVSGGKTLLELCRDDPRNIDLAVWQKHYTDQGHTTARARGLLPFRVWQFFTAMVEAVRERRIADFVCAAGILSHYVGDACQTLHSSYLNDGYRDRPTGEDDWEAKGIHSAYETYMIDREAANLIAKIENIVAGSKRAKATIVNGQGAAVDTFNLMSRALQRIPPAELCDSYVAAGGSKTVAVSNALWARWGDKTAEAMADGALSLARLWESAWALGDGPSVPSKKIKAIPFDSLVERYLDKTFIRSLDLDSIAGELR